MGEFEHSYHGMVGGMSRKIFENWRTELSKKAKSYLMGVSIANIEGIEKQSKKGQCKDSWLNPNAINKQKGNFRKTQSWCSAWLHHSLIATVTEHAVMEVSTGSLFRF